MCVLGAGVSRCYVCELELHYYAQCLYLECQFTLCEVGIYDLISSHLLTYPSIQQSLRLQYYYTFALTASVPPRIPSSENICTTSKFFRRFKPPPQAPSTRVMRPCHSLHQQPDLPISFSPQQFLITPRARSVSTRVEVMASEYDVFPQAHQRVDPN